MQRKCSELSIDSKKKETTNTLVIFSNEFSQVAFIHSLSAFKFPRGTECDALPDGASESIIEHLF